MTQAKIGWRGSDTRCTTHGWECLMLTNREPDWNIDDLTDTEIYDAICYLEPAPTTAAEQDSGDQDQGDGVVICVCLYIALGICLAFLWFYWR